MHGSRAGAAVRVVAKTSQGGLICVCCHAQQLGNACCVAAFSWRSCSPGAGILSACILPLDLGCWPSDNEQPRCCVQAAVRWCAVAVCQQKAMRACAGDMLQINLRFSLSNLRPEDVGPFGAPMVPSAPGGMPCHTSCGTPPPAPHFSRFRSHSPPFEADLPGS